MKNVKLAILVIIMSLSAIPGIFAQSSNDELLNNIFGKEGEIYFAFHAVSKAEINEITKMISIDKVTDGLMVYAYANKKEFSRFLSTGLEYKVLPHPGDYNGYMKMLDNVDLRNIEAWDFYPTYEGYIDIMNQFATDYPGICRIYSIGSTVQNRSLLIINISDNVGINENEPEVLFTSSIHGDELTGYVLMLHLIDYLLSNYGTDPSCTYIVDNIDLCICPLANPDGTYAGGNNTVNGARRYNANWVDLNRNYPDPADGPHPDGEEWQVETVNFMNYAEAHDFVSGVNLHGGAEVCNYPWDTWQYLCADDAWWVFVCREYADTVHLYGPSDYLTDEDNGITNGYAWYRITGGRQDYMNYFQQCREFTLEISDVKTPPASQLPDFWEYNYRSFLNYLEEATYGVRGTVKDATTGWPVKAEVYAILHEADSSWVYSSLPGGNYHRLLAAGTYTMRYSAAGYETEVRTGVTVVNHQATVVDVLLNPITGVGGLDSNPVSRNVEIFPNPINGNSVDIKSSYFIEKVVLYDIAGRELKTFWLNSIESSLNVEALDNGIYFLHLFTDKGEGVKKIMVSH